MTGDGFDVVDDAFRVVSQMRSQRFSLAYPGFDRVEVLTVLGEWAARLEDAMTELELARSEAGHPGGPALP